MGAMGAMMAMSAISSVGSAYSNSQAIGANGAYKQSVADTNSKIVEVQASQALERGGAAAARQAGRTDASVSAVRSGFAGQGVDLSSPTAKAFVAGAATTGALDEITIRNNAAREAWGYKVQASEATFAGKFARLTANAESKQTLLTGGIQAVQGATSIYGNYLKYSRYMGSGASPSATSEWDNKI